MSGDRLECRTIHNPQSLWLSNRFKARENIHRGRDPEDGTQRY